MGALTALTFVLTLEDPNRFAKSRAMGPYLGLVPKDAQSGQHNPQRRISGTGDEPLRRLLVGSAHYVMGPFAPDSDLRGHGEKISERGGKSAKKRAVVAVARKLSVVLHQLWVTGELSTSRFTTQGTEIRVVLEQIKRRLPERRRRPQVTG